MIRCSSRGIIFGKELSMKKRQSALSALLFCLLLAALFLTGCGKSEPEPTPTPAPTQAVQPTSAAAVTASPVKTPTPGVTAIRLYAYGRELMVADGFTLYVGDKPVEITAVLEPDVPNVPVGWTFSDQEAASLDVSSDGRTCTITAKKATGRNDITVVCQDISTSMPVFLWEK
jgi:hypothetical protein